MATEWTLGLAHAVHMQSLHLNVLYVVHISYMLGMLMKETMSVEIVLLNFIE